MPNLSNFAESGLLNHLFRASTFAKPATLAVALTSTVPTDSSVGSSMGELANTGAYARVNLGAPADATFVDITQDSLGSGQIWNVSAITFPTATADWGWASGMAILDSGVYGSGNIIVHGTLSPAKFITNGDTFSFPSGQLIIKAH